MNQLEPPYPFIKDRLQSGQVIPFLGSGASLDKRDFQQTPWYEPQFRYPPSATELADYLARMTQFPPGETRDLTKVAQYYNVVIGRRSLNEDLHRIFDDDFPLTPLHELLAAIPAKILVVTTNYDDLIERAFRDRDYDVVVHMTDSKEGDRLLHWSQPEPEPALVSPNEFDVDLQNVAVIYKMHGAIDRRDPERGQYVITEDDYIDFLARMTTHTAIPAAFAEPFMTRHFLFLGHSLRDWNLRVVLNRIERDWPRRNDMRSWAIQQEPSSLERRFWQDRGVEVYDMTIEEFVEKLRSV